MVSMEDIQSSGTWAYISNPHHMASISGSSSSQHNHILTRRKKKDQEYILNL